MIIYKTDGAYRVIYEVHGQYFYDRNLAMKRLEERQLPVRFLNTIEVKEDELLVECLDNINALYHVAKKENKSDTTLIDLEIGRLKILVELGLRGKRG